MHYYSPKKTFLVERCWKRDSLDEAIVKETGGGSVLHEDTLIFLEQRRSFAFEVS